MSQIPPLLKAAVLPEYYGFSVNTFVTYPPDVNFYADNETLPAAASPSSSSSSSSHHDAFGTLSPQEKEQLFATYLQQLSTLQDAFFLDGDGYDIRLEHGEGGTLALPPELSSVAHLEDLAKSQQLSLTALEKDGKIQVR